MATPITRVGIDVGGTFTDLVALEPDGTVRVTKVPSTPADPAAAVWGSVEAATDLLPGAILHGTTVATNALLERRGGRVVLVTTEGFEDLLWLRRQDRAGLYALGLDHPPPLLARDDVVGARERVSADGVVRPLADEEVQRIVEAVRDRRPDGVAVALLFSFSHPAHEERLAGALRAALPGCPVVPSVEVLPVFREYERISTTVAEAFLRPTVAGYVGRLAAEAQRRHIPEVRIMTSTGGTLDPSTAQRHATALALSGPAAGVEGARLIGDRIGVPDLLTLDMGGTSADASVVVDGEPLHRAGCVVGGTSLALPNVLIETVGAGGGSIAWVDEGGALRVGPQSAGAEPGPACYARGGSDATVTDAVLVLGWLDPDRPLTTDLTLDADAAGAAVARVAQLANLDPLRCAEGIVEIAVATMVRALRRVSVERGLDPRGMTLVPFGGAGPLFGCPMAESLGMSRVVVPPHAGVLSALGLAAAAPRVEAVQSTHRSARAFPAADWERAYAPLEHEVRAAIADATLTRFADCRYAGQGYEVTVPAPADPGAVAAAFHRTHAKRYGHADTARPVEIVNVRVVGTRVGTAVDLRRDGRAGSRNAARDTGAVYRGPVTIPLADATVRIEAGWSSVTHETGAMILTRDGPSRPRG